MMMTDAIQRKHREQCSSRVWRVLAVGTKPQMGARMEKNGPRTYTGRWPRIAPWLRYLYGCGHKASWRRIGWVESLSQSAAQKHRTVIEKGHLLVLAFCTTYLSLDARNRYWSERDNTQNLDDSPSTLGHPHAFDMFHCLVHSVFPASTFGWAWPVAYFAFIFSRFFFIYIFFSMRREP